MSSQVTDFFPTMNARMRVTVETPKHSPTATRTVLSSILSPSEEFGSVFNQAPDLATKAANKRAHNTASGTLSCKAATDASILHLSHDFCRSAAESMGGDIS